MLRITVEMCPGGSDNNKRTLGVMEIANCGSSFSEEVGHYQYWISQCDKPNTKWKTGRVYNFLRKKYRFWHLIKVVLNDAIKEDMKFACEPVEDE